MDNISIRLDQHPVQDVISVHKVSGHCPYNTMTMTHLYLYLDVGEGNKFYILCLLFPSSCVVYCNVRSVFNSLIVLFSDSFIISQRMGRAVMGDTQTLTSRARLSCSWTVSLSKLWA